MTYTKKNYVSVQKTPGCVPQLCPHTNNVRSKTHLDRNYICTSQIWKLVFSTIWKCTLWMVQYHIILIVPKCTFADCAKNKFLYFEGYIVSLELDFGPYIISVCSELCYATECLLNKNIAFFCVCQSGIKFTNFLKMYTLD